MSIATLAPKGFVCTHMKKPLRLLRPAMALLLICLPLFSQGNQGTIQGGVFDQSGGAVAGAMVSVVDVARGVTRALSTDDAGQFVAASLNPGTYTVRAGAKGFRTVEHSGVLLEVGQNIRVDLVVQPGEQTETITVTGEIPAVDTTDATLGGTVSNESINSLPLNGRNFERLLQLRPGVVTSPGAGTGSQSTNGMRTGEDLTMIEGLSQMSPSTGASVLNASYRTGDASSLLPIDAIQEFNTQQNPKAEYGWKAGSVINVGVKSGTNSLHGTAYAFGRNATATDAANEFSTPAFPGATPATLEQFGATAGGRIINDKLFWFLGYEGLRTTLGDVAVDTIPTDISTGDVSTSMVDACNAVGRAKVNPLSAQLAGLPAGSCIPQPSSATFENLFPFNPNPSTSFAPGLITTGPLNNGFIKGDYILGQHSHVSAMYYVSKTTQLVSYLPGQLEPQWRGIVPANAQMFNAAWTWTPGSTWVNDLRGGYAYVHNQTISADVNMNPSDPWPSGYGFNTGVNVKANPQFGGLPQIDISGFTGYLGAGKRTGVRGPEGTVNIVDSVSHLRGKHAFKFGFEFMNSIYDNNNYNQANGEIKFSNSGKGASAISPLQNFLLGNPKSGKIFIGNPELIAREHSWGGFFQDDWRLTTRVTLNLGLRYEYNQPPTERSNYIGNFNPNVTGNTPAVQQVGPGAALPSLYNADHKDFSPRVGVAWDVKGNGKTVVRAAASVLNSMLITSELLNPVPFGANFPDLGINTSGTAINAHSPVLLTAGPYNWSIAGPVFPGNAAFTDAKNITYTGLTCTSPATANGPGPCPTAAVDPNFRTPYVASWNLDIQRAITNSLTMDVAYVGNHGYKIAAEADINQSAIGAGYNTPFSAADAAAAKLPAADVGLTSNQICLATGNCGVVDAGAEVGPYSPKFPYLSQIAQLANRDFSNYNALQVTVSERAAHGLSFLAGYTYSHALDMSSSSSISQGAFPLNVYNPRLDYGNTNSDIRHRFTFSPTYAIPGMRSPGQMLQGWSLSGILSLQGGLPWYPVDATNDFTGTNEVNASSPGIQTWNYSGPTSAFSSGPLNVPCFGPLPGCTAAIPQTCVTAAQAPYTGNAQLMASAASALAANGCYVQNGGILTPPAYGTVGNASRNLFRSPKYYNVDFSVSKLWKFKERYSAQFRAEFFNLFNRADFGVPATIDPSRGAGGQFGCSCSTPDVGNPVLGSGGPRHIQFGLKLTY